MSDSHEVIQIKQLGNKYFIFNAKDVERLRCDYRIIGALNGTLPQFPLQTTFNGLPLRLLPEEVALVVKRGWAVIVGTNNHMQSLFSGPSRSLTTVFDDLWSRGFYLTTGIKFGGHYLVYPDDPMCVHSEYIVSVKEPTEEVLPLDIIGMGRAATNVKKTFILASVEPEMVTYYSIEWAGF